MPTRRLRTLLLAGLAASSLAGAQAITPRNAAAVQPRQAPSLQPRFADPVQSRTTGQAPPQPVPDTASRATMARDTAITSARPAAWTWSTIGDTAIAGDGVARGSQLKNLRCAGVACRVYQDTAGAWSVRAEGGFPQISGKTLDVLVMDTRSQKHALDTRNRGVFSNGSFWDQLDTGRLPAGSYAVFYLWREQDQVLAAMTFDMLRHAATGTATTGDPRGRRATDAATRQRIQDAARANQRCLAMAAGNPDLRCVP